MFCTSILKPDRIYMNHQFSILSIAFTGVSEPTPQEIQHVFYIKNWVWINRNNVELYVLHNRMELKSKIGDKKPLFRNVLCRQKSLFSKHTPRFKFDT